MLTKKKNSKGRMEFNIAGEIMSTCADLERTRRIWNPPTPSRKFKFLKQFTFNK